MVPVTPVTTARFSSSTADANEVAVYKLNFGGDFDYDIRVIRDTNSRSVKIRLASESGTTNRVPGRFIVFRAVRGIGG